MELSLFYQLDQQVVCYLLIKDFFVRNEVKSSSRNVSQRESYLCLSLNSGGFEERNLLTYVVSPSRIVNQLRDQLF